MMTGKGIPLPFPSPPGTEWLPLPACLAFDRALCWVPDRTLASNRAGRSSGQALFMSKTIGDGRPLLVECESERSIITVNNMFRAA